MSRCLLLCCAALTVSLGARAQVIEFESNGLKYQTLTRSGVTIMFAVMPNRLHEFATLQVAVSNGAQGSYVIKPEDFTWMRSDGLAMRASSARDVVVMLSEKGSGADVVHLITAYEASVYGNSRLKTSNGYELRRQAVLAMGSTRLKAMAVASALALVQIRLTPGESSAYTVEGDALADAQRAIRLVRARAAEWRVNPARIGIIGFSAGGEVAALAATRFDAGKPEAADGVERAGSRPDFAALIYPGIRAEAYTVPAGMPPVFLLCADNDRGPSSALAGLYPKLKAAGVQTEVHIYATGGHGFGINPNTQNASPAAHSWWDRLGDWLGEIGVLAQ